MLPSHQSFQTKNGVVTNLAGSSFTYMLGKFQEFHGDFPISIQDRDTFNVAERESILNFLLFQIWAMVLKESRVAEVVVESPQNQKA